MADKPTTQGPASALNELLASHDRCAKLFTRLATGRKKGERANVTADTTNAANVDHTKEERAEALSITARRNIQQALFWYRTATQRQASGLKRASREADAMQANEYRWRPARPAR